MFVGYVRVWVREWERLVGSGGWKLERKVMKNELVGIYE